MGFPDVGMGLSFIALLLSRLVSPLMFSHFMGFCRLQTKFLVARIKVNGKTGQLADNVEVKFDKSKIIVKADIPFSKRYLKYLTKKYLKKQHLRDWVRVVATDKNTYELRYYSISDSADEEEDGDDDEGDEE